MAQADRPGTVGRFLRDVLIDAGFGPEDTRGRRLHGEAAFEHFFDLMLEERLEMTIVSFNNTEDNVVRFFQLPWCSVGTDGVVAPDGHPHPRLFGTFPRVLGALRARVRCRRPGGGGAQVHGAGRGRRAGPGTRADAARRPGRPGAVRPGHHHRPGHLGGAPAAPRGDRRVWLAGRRVLDHGIWLPGAADPAPAIPAAA